MINDKKFKIIVRFIPVGKSELYKTEVNHIVYYKNDVKLINYLTSCRMEVLLCEEVR